MIRKNIKRRQDVLLLMDKTLLGYVKAPLVSFQLLLTRDSGSATWAKLTIKLSPLPGLPRRFFFFVTLFPFGLSFLHLLVPFDNACFIPLSLSLCSKPAGEGVDTGALQRAALLLAESGVTTVSLPPVRDP